MKHYLLAMHQPVGGPPDPEVLGPDHVQRRGRA